MAAGGVERAVLHGQRAEEVPVAEPEEAQARVQVENVRRREHAEAAGLQHAEKFAQRLAEVFEVFDDLGGGDEVEGVRCIRQRLGVQVGDLHALAGEFHQLVGVVARGGFDLEAVAHEPDEFTGARADIEVFAEGPRGRSRFREPEDGGVDVLGAHVGRADSSRSAGR